MLKLVFSAVSSQIDLKHGLVVCYNWDSADVRRVNMSASQNKIFLVGRLYRLLHPLSCSVYVQKKRPFVSSQTPILNTLPLSGQSKYLLYYLNLGGPSRSRREGAAKYLHADKTLLCAATVDYCSARSGLTVQSQTLDSGLWCLQWKIRGLHWDGAGHHQPVKTLVRKHSPLTKSENLDWVVSWRSSLEQRSGYLFWSYRSLCANGSQQIREGKTVWNFLVRKQHLLSGLPSHHTGVFHKAPPPSKNPFPEMAWGLCMKKEEEV